MEFALTDNEKEPDEALPLETCRFSIDAFNSKSTIFHSTVVWFGIHFYYSIEHMEW